MTSTGDITFAVHGSGLVLLRSDQGDGGWSLHTPEQIADGDADEDAPEMLLAGKADWDDELDDWNRPNKDDVAKAERIRDQINSAR